MWINYKFISYIARNRCQSRTLHFLEHTTLKLQMITEHEGSIGALSVFIDELRETYGRCRKPTTGRQFV